MKSRGVWPIPGQRAFDSGGEGNPPPRPGSAGQPQLHLGMGFRVSSEPAWKELLANTLFNHARTTLRYGSVSGLVPIGHLPASSERPGETWIVPDYFGMSPANSDSSTHTRKHSTRRSGFWNRSHRREGISVRPRLPFDRRSWSAPALRSAMQGAFTALYPGRIRTHQVRAPTARRLAGRSGGEIQEGGVRRKVRRRELARRGRPSG